MIRRLSPIAGLIFCLLTACSAPGPSWRAKATELVDDLARQNVLGIFPQEYNNLLETFEHGEAVMLVQEDVQEADTFYLLALQKGTVLKGELEKRQRILAEKKRQQEAEAEIRAEEERLMMQAAEAEVRLREQERLQSVLKEQASAAAKVETETTIKESSVLQASVYTVRRGETLPQIAARSEIYNDASLWPLIYRANRDQIRNPRQLWPGQALKIPRHFSRDEAMEAKRYSGKK
jgi:nucleoid-associated protein YgaU